MPVFLSVRDLEVIEVRDLEVRRVSYYRPSQTKSFVWLCSHFQTIGMRGANNIKPLERNALGKYEQLESQSL